MAAATSNRGQATHYRTTPTSNRLLNESWRAVRAPLQDALKAVPQRAPDAAPECAALAAASRKLDEALASRASPGDVWRQYRRLLVFYSQVRASRLARGGLADCAYSISEGGCMGAWYVCCVSRRAQGIPA